MLIFKILTKEIYYKIMLFSKRQYGTITNLFIRQITFLTK